ncbi:hypothetical protein M8542_14570 [Amycolatopsis sp. OK19-0408]|uniref:Uncharacterized protein n=1 Tax=Amycolatopsis iheyensis TaxID=2945988 RepID=A0A9X2SL18_9PSEU|nr:hypothetical protein [Amycolatopsis iheyensis]
MVEQDGVDEWFVAAADLLALMRDVADVVPVTKHQRQLVDRDPLGRPPWCRPGPQAPLVQFLIQVRQRVVTGRVQLECQSDERGALRIDGYRADLAALGLRFTDVQVAEPGDADGAAVFDLLAHLVADVRAAGFGLVLVDGVQDGLHHGALRAFAHVENGGDNPGTDPLQVPLGDARVNAVSEDSVEVVDDDVVDVFLRLHPGDHLLKGWSFVDAGGGATRLDELADNVRVKLCSLVFAGLALGRDRDAFWIVVGVNLSGRRYTEVEHRALAATFASRVPGDVTVQGLLGHRTSLLGAVTLVGC